MSVGNFRTPSPALILLSGLPGAGKTTFARALAERVPLQQVESDSIRRGLAAQPSYTPAESAEVFRRAGQLASEGLTGGHNVVVDATNLSPRDRRRFVRLAERHGATLVAIRLTAPETTIRERLSSPRKGFSQATMAVYEMMRTRPRPFSMPVIVIDTRFGLEPNIDLVLRLIHDEGS